MGIVLAEGLTLFVWSLAWVTLAGGGGRHWCGGRIGSGGVHDVGSVSRADVNSCGWQVGPEINGAMQASMESKKTVRTQACVLLYQKCPFAAAGPC